MAEVTSAPTSEGGAAAQARISTEDLEERVWDELGQCFDPEIPVNIVDLGLVYAVRAEPLSAGDHHVARLRRVRDPAPQRRAAHCQPARRARCRNCNHLRSALDAGDDERRSASAAQPVVRRVLVQPKAASEVTNRNPVLSRKLSSRFPNESAKTWSLGKASLSRQGGPRCCS